MFPPLNYLLEQPLLGKEAETERGRENDSLGRIPGPDGTRPPSTAPAPGHRVGRTRNSFSDGHASLLAELSSPRRPRPPAARTGPHTREPAGLAAPAGTGILGDDPLCRGRSCRQRDSRAASLPGPCAPPPTLQPEARPVPQESASDPDALAATSVALRGAGASYFTKGRPCRTRRGAAAGGRLAGSVPPLWLCPRTRPPARRSVCLRLASSPGTGWQGLPRGGGAHVLSGPAPMLQSRPAHSSPSHPATQGPRASGHWEPGFAPAAGRAPDVSSPEPVLPRPAWPRRARALAGFTDSNAARIARCKRKHGQRTLLETCPGVVSDPPDEGRRATETSLEAAAAVRGRQCEASSGPGNFQAAGLTPSGLWVAGWWPGDAVSCPPSHNLLGGTKDGIYL